MYSTKKLTHCSYEVRIPYTRIKDEYWFLLSSDHHWDNPKCKQKLLRKHLEIAKEKKAGIFVFGDLFCAMQGKYDRRSNKSAVRPEHQTDRYLDSLVETGVEWYSPYANDIILISPGNHETAILKHHETDLTDRLVSGLNLMNKTKIIKGTYSGFVVFKFESKSGGAIRTMTLFYHHGYGGGGPVTKGVIQANRKAVYLPDPNVVVSGHIHEKWIFPIQRERIRANGETYQDTQYHVCTPTYKEEYGVHEGFHIEGGRPPKPLGAYWMILKPGRKSVEIDFLEAR